jgi:hypothetical protein
VTYPPVTYPPKAYAVASQVYPDPVPTFRYAGPR